MLLVHFVTAALISFQQQHLNTRLCQRCWRAVRGRWIWAQNNASAHTRHVFSLNGHEITLVHYFFLILAKDNRLQFVVRSTFEPKQYSGHTVIWSLFCRWIERSDVHCERRHEWGLECHRPGACVSSSSLEKHLYIREFLSCQVSFSKMHSAVFHCVGLLSHVVYTISFKGILYFLNSSIVPNSLIAPLKG